MDVKLGQEEMVQKECLRKEVMQKHSSPNAQEVNRMLDLSEEVLLVDGESVLLPALQLPLDPTVDEGGLRRRLLGGGFKLSTFMSYQKYRIFSLVLVFHLLLVEL